ncbi:MAG: Nif11-like leader peptide family RiPP precursor [Clostridia bacterium]|nr:Nif11-like leader peptide family RiPP precursor [Clostridia bacterium]
MDNKEKLDALMKDEAFVKKLEACKTAAEIIALYKEQGIEVTEENAKAGLAVLQKGDELDESALENVSGGTLGALVGIATIATAHSVIIGLNAVSDKLNNAAWAIDTAGHIIADDAFRSKI